MKDERPLLKDVLVFNIPALFLIVFWFLMMLTTGCVNVTLVDAATMAVSSACDGMTDKECVEAVAEGICEGTDSVRKCLARYAKARP